MNKRDRIRKHGFVVIIFVVFVGPQLVSCQKSNDDGDVGGSGAGIEIFAQEMYNSMSGFTSVFKGAIKKELGYCILDV